MLKNHPGHLQEAVLCLTGEVLTPKVPSGSSPTMQNMGSWYLLPQFTPGTHDVTAGWAASPDPHLQDE